MSTPIPRPSSFPAEWFFRKSFPSASNYPSWSNNFPLFPGKIFPRHLWVHKTGKVLYYSSFSFWCRPKEEPFSRRISFNGLGVKSHLEKSAKSFWRRSSPFDFRFYFLFFFYHAPFSIFFSLLLLLNLISSAQFLLRICPAAFCRSVCVLRILYSISKVLMKWVFRKDSRKWFQNILKDKLFALVHG